MYCKQSTHDSSLRMIWITCCNASTCLKILGLVSRKTCCNSENNLSFYSNWYVFWFWWIWFYVILHIFLDVLPKEGSGKCSPMSPTQADRPKLSLAVEVCCIHVLVKLWRMLLNIFPVTFKLFRDEYLEKQPECPKLDF